MKEKVDNPVDAEVSFATFFGYRNGSRGPSLSILRKVDKSNVVKWPCWSDTLNPIDYNTFIEGGKRTKGILKHGTYSNPLVSYVTVVRNNDRTLERTIKSVQNQTYTNIEHIVIDGASTDATLSIIKKHETQIDYFVSEPDRGLYDALNKAIPLARGQLICVLNSDDWLEPDAAEIAIKYYNRHPNGMLLMTAALVRDGKITHKWDPAFVNPGSYFTCANDCHNAIYASPEAYEATGPYDDTYKIAADFKWIMSALDSNVQFIYTSEATVNYSLGGASGDFMAHSNECMRVVRERFPALTQVEAHGLYHCFFGFSNPQSRFELDIPPNHTLFLRTIFANHQSDPEFLLAMAWASIVKLSYPSEPPVSVGPYRLDRLFSKLRQQLAKHPIAYKVARRIYRRLKPR